MNNLSVCFKVVRYPRKDSEMRQNSELRWSVFAGLKYEVAYLPGRNTGPMVKGSKLYAFETQREAVRFAEGCRQATSDFMEVWLAMAENAKWSEWVSYLPFCRTYYAKEFDYFWNLVKAGNRSMSNYRVAEPPPRTVECEALILVTLLERFEGIKEPDLIFRSVSA